MKKLVLLGLPLTMTLAILAQTESIDETHCHDLKTGEYRLITAQDNPQHMKSHGGRPEFEKPHLQCNPSEKKKKSL